MARTLTREHRTGTRRHSCATPGCYGNVRDGRVYCNWCLTLRDDATIQPEHPVARCSCGKPSALPSGGDCRKCMARWLTSARNTLAWEGRA